MKIPLSGKWLLLLLVTAFAVFAAGCSGGSKEKGAKDPGAEVPVTVARAEKGVLQDVVSVTGKIEAVQSANVVPSGAGGKVAQVLVDVGDRVQKGQMLVILENQLQAAEVRRTEAMVAAARAQLEQAEGALSISRAELEKAAANYERGKELLAGGALAQAAFESQYELPYQRAKEAAERTVPAQVRAARASLAQAEAALQAARESYDNTFIRSPISGVVTARNVNPGEMASAAVPAVSVANLDAVVVKVTVAEDVINSLKEGQKVEVRVAAVSERPFTGTIYSIAPAADQATKAFPVKVKLSNPQHTLKPGMFAEVRLTRKQQKAVLLPREAVVSQDGREVVWLVEDGKAVCRKVKTGASDGTRIAILEGVPEGAVVVTVGQGSLRDGVKVKITNQVEAKE